MVNWSGIDRKSAAGQFLRWPLRLLPPRLVVPIMAGPNRGLRWRVGAFDRGCWLGSFETEKQQRLRERLSAGMTAFDIGAHTGFYTLLMSRSVGGSGRVFAFEPWPANVADCVAHTRMNHLSNVVVVPSAVSNTSGLSSFGPGSTTSSGALASADSAIRVACFTLDELVSGVAVRFRMWSRSTSKGPSRRCSRGRGTFYANTPRPGSSRFTRHIKNSCAFACWQRPATPCPV